MGTISTKKLRRLLLYYYDNCEIASVLIIARHILRDKPEDQKTLAVLGELLPSICRFTDGHNAILKLQRSTRTQKWKAKIFELHGKSCMEQRSYSRALEWLELSYKAMKGVGFSLVAGISIETRVGVLKGIIKSLSVLERLDEAQLYGERLLELECSARNVFYVAKIYRQAGRYQEALRVCQRSPWRLKRLEQDLTLTCEFLLHSSTPKHTKTCFDEDEHPDWCLAYRFETGRRFCRLKPRAASGQLMLSTVARDLSRFKEAKAAALKCIELPRCDETSVEMWLMLLRMYTDSGSFEAAIGFGERAIQMAPDYATTCIYTGVCLLRQGRLEDALICHEKGTQATRGCIDEAHLNAGLVLRGLEKYEKALEHVDRALELDPDYSFAEDVKDDLEQALRLKKRLW